MNGRRQSRTRRRRGVAAVLTARDEALLHALSRFRLARTSDLLTYAFSGIRRDTATDRLRRLFDAKYLAVLPAKPGEENVYRLGPSGRSWLRQEGIVATRPPRGGFAHHLGIVSAWVALAGAEAIELERALPDWEIREQFAGSHLPVIPDLLLRIRAEGTRHVLAVEVDRGTESLAILRRKLEAYRSLWGQPPGLFGLQQFGILLACDSPRRTQLTAALKNAWAIPHALWTRSEPATAMLHKLFRDLVPPIEPTPYDKGC